MKSYFKHSLGHFLGFLGFAAVISVIVMLLWNWLMPTIFGLSCISLWQAFGLLVLSRLLFGSFPSGWMARREMARHHRHPLYEKWAEMNEKEREEFIKNRHRGFHGYPFGQGHSHSENNSEQ